MNHYARLHFIGVRVCGDTYVRKTEGREDKSVISIHSRDFYRLIIVVL